MAGIISNVDSDVQKLRKLKNEIENVKKALKGINITVDVDIAKGLQSQLTSLIGQYDTLVDKIAVAEGKIMLSVSRINKATEKIVQAQEKVSKPVDIPAQTGNVNTQTNTAETASIQAQAKAYDDLRTEINDILGTRDANVKRMVEEMNTIRLINAEIKKITKSQGESSSLSSTQQRRLEQLNNSLLTHKTALSEVRQTLNNNVKLDNAAATSMNGLSQSLSRMKMTYRELTEEERKSPFGKELLESINQADTKMKELDATIGNHQRNVGNYGKQWNGLSMSIQQLGRELPSLAYGPKVFFSAISNNLPILADEIRRARTEYELLKKSGQSATPVWKQAVSSLFSWQSALTVGITLLTLYGDKVVDWVTGLFKAKEVIKELLSAEQEMALARKKAISDSTKERAELDLLYNKLKGTFLSTKERTAAVDEWMKKYPQYSNIMNGELVSLGKLESAYQSLSKQIIESARARAYTDKITELETKKDEALLKRQNQYVTYLKAIDDYDKAVNEYNEKKETGFGTATAKLEAENKIFRAEQNIKDQKKAWMDLISETKAYEQSISIISKKIKVDDLYPQPEEGTYDYWQQQVQIADVALKQIKDEYMDILKGGNAQEISVKVPDDVVQQYNVLVKQKKVAEEKLKIYDDNSSKQESAAEKLRKEQEKYALLMDKQALEQKRSAEDLQMKVDETRIKVMDEGSAKTIAEMELNFEKEMQAIDRQKEDALRKKIEDARTAWDANPENKGKSFDGSGITLSKDENTPFNELYKGGIAAFEKNLKEYQDKQDDAWNEYYIKYGEYQEKRKAIMDKYDKQIADAKEGSVEKSTFIAQRKEDLDSLDDELMKNSELWGRFFTDFSNRSSSSIRNIIEDIQELIDYMNGIEGTKIPDLFKDNEKTVKAINNAMANPSSLNKFTSSLSSQIAKFKKMLDKDNPFKQIQEGFKNNDFESTSKGFSGIASAVRELDGVLGDLGVKSDSTAGKVTSVLSSTASYAATGASIGGPWGAVIGGAIGMASGLIGVLGADYSAYNKMKEEYGALIDVWDMLISKKQKYIDISYGDEARKVGQEVLDLLNKKAQSNVALGVERLNAGASAGSHSIGVRQRKGMSSQGWDELRKAAQSIGFDYNSVADGRMTGLFSLTAEQLERLQEEAPTFWAKLDGDVQGYLQNIIDCSDEIEDMKTKLQETMTGVSFDSFYDSFVSTLSDMDKSSKDMADDFGEYLKNAILENLVANKYRSKIEALYKDWAAKSDSNGDGIFDLTTQESAELKEAQKALAEQIMAERDAMADAFGWDSSSTSQSSTSKGFEAMSQDTGEELNGRFTALQIAGEEVKNQNVIQSQSLNLLTAKADTILSVNTETRNIADDTRDLIAQSYLELVQISENTGAIVKPIQQMQRDIAEVKKNTAKL